MAEVLADSGYLTMGVGANTAFLAHAYGLDQGFSVWSVRPGLFFEKDGFYLRQGVRTLLKPVLSPSFGMSYRRAAEINQDAFGLLDSARASERPLFLFVNYMDAHFPYEPPPPFDSRFPGAGTAMPESQYYDLMRQVMCLKHNLTPAERSRLTSHYDGAIAYLDSEIGKLVQHLKSTGMFDNTLLIITADHGESFGEKALMNHGASVYQDEVHVPLLIKCPRTRTAAVVSDVVSSVDLMPTVLNVAGSPFPANVQGESLLNAASPRRDVLSESFPNSIWSNWHPRFRAIRRAVFQGTEKLLTSTTGERELFDIARDPAEARNLYPVEPDVGRDLEAKLERSLHTVAAAPREAPQGSAGKEQVDRLKSLGYIQ
jgi:arylsulfatase A-like enzyme